MFYAMVGAGERIFYSVTLLLKTYCRESGMGGMNLFIKTQSRIGIGLLVHYGRSQKTRANRKGELKRQRAELLRCGLLRIRMLQEVAITTMSLSTKPQKYAIWNIHGIMLFV